MEKFDSVRARYFFFAGNLSASIIVIGLRRVPFFRHENVIIISATCKIRYNVLDSDARLHIFFEKNVILFDFNMWNVQMWHKCASYKFGTCKMH